MGLITTIEELKEHVAINGSMEFKSIEADVRLMQEGIQDVLGYAFFDELVEQLEGELSDEQKRLVFLLRSALGNLSLDSYLDMGQVQISDAGVQIVSTADLKTAFQWQITALRTSLRRKGYNGLERALAFLDKNRELPAFATWASSDAAQAGRAHFINTAAEFSAEYNISNERLTFLALQSLLKKTEDFALEPALGTDYYDELRAQQAAGTLSAENAALVSKYLRPALAHLTMAQAIGELGFSLNGANLELNVFRADDSNSKESDPGLQQLLDMKAGQALDDGERYLRRMRKHLNESASETRYATYFASSAYQASKATTYTATDSSSPVFGAF